MHIFGYPDYEIWHSEAFPYILGVAEISLIEVSSIEHTRPKGAPLYPSNKCRSLRQTLSR